MGTFTKKIQCQSSDCVNAPPASSPIEPPPAETNANTPIARACSEAPGNSVTMIARDAAQHRGADEEEHAGEKDLLAPDEIAQAPGQQEKAAERDQVAVDDP